MKDLPKAPHNRRGWPWTEDSTSFLSPGVYDGKLWPKVSIVTPSYNQGRFIEQTIRSVLLQGYPNLEYIIIDGGSDDETVSIIQRYESFITYWISEPDQGQGNAINKGFEMATGDICNWVNSDDWLAPDSLLFIVNEFINNSLINVIYGDFYFTDELGNVDRKFPTKPFTVTEMFKRNIIGQPTVFFRRLLWQEFGAIDQRWDFILDYELWLRWALHGVNFVYYPRILAYYRIHSNSKTSTIMSVAQDEVLQMLDQFMEQNLLSTQQRDMIPEIVLSFCYGNYAILDPHHFWKMFRVYVLKFKQIPNLKLCIQAVMLLLGSKNLGLLRIVKHHFLINKGKA